MNKKTVSFVMVVFMLLAVSFYFIGGTYARYASEFTGEASLEVAKWDVNLNGKDSTETNMELTFTVTDNTNVVAGKIAPGVTATAQVEIDLSDTEVAVDVYADATEDALASAVAQLGMEASDVTFSVSVAGGSGSGAGTKSEPYKLALPDGSAFNTETGKITVTLTVKWENNEHNEKDTAAGEKGGTEKLTIPVTLHVEQHIGA